MFLSPLSVPVCFWLLCAIPFREVYVDAITQNSVFGPLQMVHSQQLALNSPESGGLLQLNPSGRKEASEGALSQACY